jgi:hypothetical protein
MLKVILKAQSALLRRRKRPPDRRHLPSNETGRRLRRLFEARFGPGRIFLLGGYSFSGPAQHTGDAADRCGCALGRVMCRQLFHGAFLDEELDQRQALFFVYGLGKKLPIPRIVKPDVLLAHAPPLRTYAI